MTGGDRAVNIRAEAPLARAQARTHSASLSTPRGDEDLQGLLEHGDEVLDGRRRARTLVGGRRELRGGPLDGLRHARTLIRGRWELRADLQR